MIITVLKVLIIVLSSSSLAFFAGVKLRSRVIDFLKTILTGCLEKPEEMSRMVYLLHGIATAFGIVAVTVAFMFAKDRTDFPTMLTVLGANGVGNSIGRYFTKAGDGKQDDREGRPDPS